jgi:two-component system, NtrC family, sensor kinase
MPEMADDPLERFFAFSLDLMCIASVDGRFVRVSASFTTTLGYPREELQGRRWLDLVHPEDREATVAAGARLAGGGPVVSFVNRYRHRDGGYRFLEWMARPADGVIYAVARDVTERHDMEEAVRASERRHRLILDGALNIFIAMDAAGRVVAWNSQAEATFGWSRIEAVGEELAQLIIPPRDREAHRRGLARYLDSGEARMLGQRLELEALHRDGEAVPVEVLLSVLRVDDELTFFAFMHDIRERKRTQAIGLETARLAALGETVAGVAHEVNNPLAFVSNNVAVLSRDLAGLRELLQLYRQADEPLTTADPELHARVRALADRIDLPYTLGSLDRILRRTREGLARIQQIVKDLRDFARLDEADRHEADLNEGILSTVNILRGLARAHGVPDIQLDLPPLPRLLCYPAKLNQVVMNLVSNAIDASPPGSPVTVRTRASAESITIEVEDEGPGVSPAVAERLFDPFFTTKPPGKGTGLGLSISYGIVKDHGGTISVEAPEGGGTRFVVTLPLRPAA